jgi:hypothetical protein
MACSTGCQTRDHSSYGECLRSKSTRVAYCNTVNGWDATKQKNWDRELANYRQAVKDGMNPATCTQAAIDAAYAKADGAAGGN